MFDIPIDFFIDKALLQGVYDVFRLTKSLASQKGVTKGLLINSVLGLVTQENKDRLLDLIKEINRITPQIYTIKQKYNEDKATRNAEKAT